MYCFYGAAWILAPSNLFYGGILIVSRVWRVHKKRSHCSNCLGYRKMIVDLGKIYNKTFRHCLCIVDLLWLSSFCLYQFTFYLHFTQTHLFTLQPLTCCLLTWTLYHLVSFVPIVHYEILKCSNCSCVHGATHSISANPRENASRHDIIIHWAVMNVFSSLW